MPRKVLMRDVGGERVATEAELLTEQRLHDVLTEHPELIPAEDLGLGSTVVVGRESGLEAGRADLVLVDGAAQLCLVEVKKEGNPDTRKVVAQLIDYASSLWRMSSGEFERTVLHPYLRTSGVSDAELPDVATYVARKLTVDDDDLDEAVFDDFAERLERTLSSGRFRLVVAAPAIPASVQRNIEFMNDQGMLLYGLEVSYFAGETECFAPLLVVRPRASEKIRLADQAGAVTESTFIPRLPERVGGPLAAFLRDCQAAGIPVRWVSFGPWVHTSRTPDLNLCCFFVKQVVVELDPPSGYPRGPFEEAKIRLGSFAAGTLKKEGTRWACQYSKLSDQDVVDVLEVVLALARAVALPVDFTTLEEPIVAQFTRNDNNVWAKSAPALADRVGEWLRGTLVGPGSMEQHPVTLEPLGAGQPGWKPPRFASTEVAVSSWPANEFGAEYSLTIEDAGAPSSEDG